MPRSSTVDKLICADVGPPPAKVSGAVAHIELVKAGCQYDVP